MTSTAQNLSHLILSLSLSSSVSSLATNEYTEAFDSISAIQIWDVQILGSSFPLTSWTCVNTTFYLSGLHSNSCMPSSASKPKPNCMVSLIFCISFHPCWKIVDLQISDLLHVVFFFNPMVYDLILLIFIMILTWMYLYPMLVQGERHFGASYLLYFD